MIKANLFTEGELTDFPMGFRVFKGPVYIQISMLLHKKSLYHQEVAVKCKMVTLKMKRHTEF